jgi:uncharacterized protein (DUF2147 family)
MFKKISILVLCLLFGIIVYPLMASQRSEVFGFWKSVDTRRNFTTSVIGIYEYNGQMYGRTIVGYDERSGILVDTIYNPSHRVEKLPGRPLLHTVDLLWELKHDGVRWRGGKILDPRYGNIFNCEAWIESGTLIIRGKVGPFGMNKVFYKIDYRDIPTGFILPDLTDFTPNVPVK